MFSYHSGHWWESLSTQKVRNQIPKELDKLSSEDQWASPLYLLTLIFFMAFDLRRRACGLMEKEE